MKNKIIYHLILWLFIRKVNSSFVKQKIWRAIIFKPSFDGIPMKTRGCGCITKTHFLSIVLNKYIVPAITSLLFNRGPSNVARLIVAI